MNSTGVEVTAGLGGFLVLFGLALAVWFLGWDMTRRLRGMRQRELQRLAQEAERTQRAGRADDRNTGPGPSGRQDLGDELRDP